MTPKVIRFWTTHPERSPAYWHRWFCLPDSHMLVFDDKAPEYLIVTEHIYLDRSLLLRFNQLDSPNRISILAAGEALSPDLNLFDYASTYDSSFACPDRIIRKPPALFFRFFGFDALQTEPGDRREILRAKTGFCNFIYSNPKAHPRRDQIFNVLSRYKHVDSLGPHLNNVGNKTSRSDVGWEQLLIDMKRPYKFSIAAENATFAGYSTEKLISSFQAISVPIYWGDPDIAEEFNQQAFINANGLSDEELLKTVRKIDQDDDLWCDMASQPAMTEDQLRRLAEGTEKFKSFFLHVFDDRPIPEKKRAPVGFWNDIYRSALFNPESDLHLLWRQRWAQARQTIARLVVR